MELRCSRIGVPVGSLLLLERFGWPPQRHVAVDGHSPEYLVWRARPSVVVAHSRYRGHGLLSDGAALFLSHCKHRNAVFRSFVSLSALVWWFSAVRRRVEEDLRKTRDKLRIEVEERSSLLDLTHDSIFVRDMDFVITYWNRGAEEFYGWTQTDAIGKRSDDLLHSAFPKLVEIRAQLLEKDQWEGELTRTKADGHQVTVASRWSLRRDQQGRPVAILETSNDITARKRWEEEIQGLNQDSRTVDALEASNKELEAFAYSISHDLRAPLRHLAGFADLLRKNAAASLNEKSQRYVTMILKRQIGWAH